MSATIHASIDKVDIAEWVLNLPDAEYRPFTNLLINYPTRAVLDALEAVGQPFENPAADLPKTAFAHNRVATPLLAASIDRKAPSAANS